MSQPHDSWKKQKLKANSTTQRNSSKPEKCIWNRRRALARVGSKVWIIIIAYRLKWQEESKVKFLTGIKSGLLKASEHHLRLRKEYKLWNTDATSSKYLNWQECFKKIKEHFPYFDYFNETISVAFLYWLFWHCSRRLLSINGKSSFAIFKTLVLWTFWLNTCTAAFSHLIKLREKD